MNSTRLKRDEWNKQRKRDKMEAGTGRLPDSPVLSLSDALTWFFHKISPRSVEWLGQQIFKSVSLRQLEISELILVSRAPWPLPVIATKDNWSKQAQ
jgi:hypothetical protein